MSTSTNENETTVITLNSVAIDTPIVTQNTSGDIVISSTKEGGKVILGASEIGNVVFSAEPYVTVYCSLTIPEYSERPLSTVIVEEATAEVIEQVTPVVVEQVKDEIVQEVIIAEFPVATTEVAGKVMIGNGVNVDEEGRISVESLTAPATKETLGGIIVGENLTITAEGVLSANPGGYTLPVANAETLGGIKVGNNLVIDENGVLSAVSGSYTLPVASETTLGGVKIGENLAIDSSGVLSATLDLDSCADLIDAVKTIKQLKSCLYEIRQVEDSDSLQSFVDKFNVMLDILNSDFDN